MRKPTDLRAAHFIAARFLAARLLTPRFVTARFLLTASCFAAGASSWAQTAPAAPQQAAEATNAQAQAFEVVSIKPHNTALAIGGSQSTPDGYRWTNFSMEQLIQGAYDVSMPRQIEGLPGWAKSERYDIEVKLDADTVAAWKDLSYKERWKRVRPMEQALLADRCKLKGHLMTREMPVYDLVIAKGGLKMKEAAPDETATGSISSSASGTSVTMHAQSTDSVMGAIGMSVGRLVVDKTGLGEKKFDYEFSYADDQRASDTASDPGPSIFSALEDQLGLKLVPDKGPVIVLIIDSIERPSPN